MDDKQLHIRLPENLKNWLQDQAAINDRTLVGEIRRRLEKSRAEDLKKHGQMNSTD